jgi:hypothetical protein
MTTYRCHTCGEEHDELPDLGFDAPDPYLEVPEEERAERTVFTPDRCIVRDDDGEHYYYERYAKSETMAPTFGWLSNRIPHYDESTFLLKTRAHFRDGGLRPTIELEPTAHPLAVDQRKGITLERAWEIVHRYRES